MTPTILKEFRCKNCNKLFFKGHILEAIIEIKCKNCKSVETIDQMQSVTP
ncbi:MAG: Com family DNA-binding transcriptional regulator [Candidatus Magasanikbacteria bacterium CG10_big_fil_rev_8_21_14_0_10_47_10]|uniref:Com family DNA-binding transcriptional regulator n=1 Tax=Candidatus Magasanikbacteria bacterium CG10_big_fil_rev_8_21_14_0_10_47_10 TaxID=1974652 RepID=A0A2H0TPL4_9BACT|nr:MAG: Com family DNA-binding transcriptional regulator [Candidatus Magasanikbacteria bacterium CG10_big_fil_rev_8_21_14_0_10_47_10]